MLKSALEDRRIFARFPAAVSLGYLNIYSNKEGMGQTHDISASGIGLVTSRRLRASSILDMWLNVPGHSEPFYTRGEVIWISRIRFNKYRAGIKLEKPELMAIAQVLEAVNKEQSRPSENQQNTSKKLLSKILIFFRVRST